MWQVRSGQHLTPERVSTFDRKLDSRNQAVLLVGGWKRSFLFYKIKPMYPLFSQSFSGIINNRTVKSYAQNMEYTCRVNPLLS